MNRGSGPAARPVVPRPRALAVVVPAHDEEELVVGCLRSVQAAVAVAGLPSAIVLVAHRCTDRTVERASAVLSGPGQFVLTDDSPTVATARRAGVEHARRLLATRADPAGPAATWLLSTDADSVVPPTWVADLHRHMDTGAAAVAGLVSVHDWDGASPAAREAYAAILRAGFRHRPGPGGGRHDHVYGANLAVRMDAYLDVGGWPDQVPGEDTALVAALRQAGWPVATPRDVRVRTSGRRRGRAEGGLGSLLDHLATTFSPEPVTGTVGAPRSSES